MAKSTTAVATRLTTTVATGSPYQLDSAQLSKATTALLAHIKSHAVKKEQQATKKSLLADSDGAEDGTVAALQGVPIWLTVGTKKHITDHTKLKPSKVLVDLIFSFFIN
jgi:ribosome biogenesis protein UTP30